MAKLVEDVMSQELYSVRVTASVEEALAYLLMIDVTSSPVLGADGRLVGVVSLRDLVQQRTGRFVRDRMTPPPTILQTALVTEAGHALAQMNLHRMVVIDDEGEAVGMVSAIDVVRGLLGAPTPHPQPFAAMVDRRSLLPPALIEEAPSVSER